MRLASKKAIVTGATRSIGKAIALAFAREGADVVISYHSDGRGAEDTVVSIHKLGRAAKSFHADFSDLAEVGRFFDKALGFL